jgi:predicted restriction endonuclease
VCGAQAVDIHHIEARGMGGSKHADRIENLMALCRKHHEMYGDRKQWKDWLQKVHDLKIKRE